MSNLRTALQEYLALRRALGFKLRLAGGLLHRFLQFAEKERASFITTELALRWATQAKCEPSQWANRLAMVRQFAQYRSAEPRFHRRGCCRIGTIENLPTFIATMRLCGLSKQPKNCLRLKAYEQRHTRHYWGCSRLRACGSANRYTWIVTMWIWQRESSRFAKPSLVNRDWFQSILPPRKCFAIMPASEIGFSRVR